MLQTVEAVVNPDALHLATAQHHGCIDFWTNDWRLNKAAGGLNILSLNDQSYRP